MLMILMDVVEDWCRMLVSTVCNELKRMESVEGIRRIFILTREHCSNGEDVSIPQAIDKGFVWQEYYSIARIVL
jgi:hypothetical protein